MTKEEELDWLCRLRSEIYVFMPKEWLIPMNNALDMAIKALEYDDAKYHAEHGEVIVDKAVWEDAKKALEQSHDGCKDCKYETYPEYYYPCCECKQNYTDMWEKKPHWIEKGVTVKCSECGSNYATHWRFCPNCGNHNGD